MFNSLLQILDLILCQTVAKLLSSTRSGRKRINRVNNLYFSPCSSPNDPLILLSVSSSINFWNIKALQNNITSEIYRKISTNSKSRLSSRFRSPLKLNSISNNPEDITQSERVHNSNYWDNKTGPSEKPELLSSHKLIGKSAKKVIFNEEFDEFVTVDNEGHIYYLRLIEYYCDVSKEKKVNISYRNSDENFQ